MRTLKKSIWSYMYKVTFALVSVILISITALNIANEQSRAQGTADKIFEQMDKMLEENQKELTRLRQEYAAKCLHNTEAIAYILEKNTGARNDLYELRKIAEFMEVDEIHIIDAAGEIVSGTHPQYYGYSFDSGEQMNYFKPMLKNKSLTMCQDVTPNTAEGKKMMYAITWNEDGTKMIQVGIEPKRLLNEIKQNNISNVVARMPVYKGIEIIVADADTQVIEGATDSSKLGKKLEDVGISANPDSDDGATVTQIRMDGKHCRCMMRQNDNYIVFVTVEDSFYQQGGMIAIFIVGAYLVLASCCITYMFSKVMKERLEKEKLIYTSNTDELTRCLNRHAYENDMKKLNLSEEWVYISVDLNGLKRANDSYGHMAGDELICAAADCMRDSFHEYGKVYRIGGDEFAVIITENPNQVEELIHSFDSNVANWHGKFVDSMTVSYGWVFSTERNWGSAYEISKAADARMYQSKERYYKESGADRR